jgi:DNA-binding response OmpR family regulator
LIVSDRPQGSAAWESDLESKGFLLLHQPSGGSIASILGARGCELVIFNLQAPFKELVQICARTRESFAGPLLVLLSQPDPQGMLDLYQAGADECLLMPEDSVLLPVKTLAWTRRYQWAGQYRLPV